MATTIIRLYEIVGKRACNEDQGDIVNAIIRQEFEKGNTVSIDYDSMEQVLTAFLNAAVGIFFKDNDFAFVSSHIKYRNTDEVDKALIKKVYKRAIEYYSNPQKMDKIINDAYNN